MFNNLVQPFTFFTIKTKQKNTKKHWRLKNGGWDGYTGLLTLQYALPRYKVSLQSHKDEVITWKLNTYRHNHKEGCDLHVMLAVLWMNYRYICILNYSSLMPILMDIGRLGFICTLLSDK